MLYRIASHRIVSCTFVSYRIGSHRRSMVRARHTIMNSVFSRGLPRDFSRGIYPAIMCRTLDIPVSRVKCEGPCPRKRVQHELNIPLPCHGKVQISFRQNTSRPDYHIILAHKHISHKLKNNPQLSFCTSVADSYYLPPKPTTNEIGWCLKASNAQHSSQS